MMDIVDKILKEIPGLYPFYKEHMDYYDDEGNPEIDINLGTKLGALNMAFRCKVKDLDFYARHIKKILDMLEEFAQTATEEELGQLEVMFLEDLVWWAEDKEDEPAKRYGNYFLSCLGPKCCELCKRNKEFWIEVKRNKPKAWWEEEFENRNSLQALLFQESTFLAGLTVKAALKVKKAYNRMKKGKKADKLEETPKTELQSSYQAEKHRHDLREKMGRPQTKDPELARELKKLYKTEYCMGSSSTAAAVRQEIRTGQTVGVKFRSQKIQGAMTLLEKWLKNNSTARPGDRAASENMLADLKDALSTVKGENDGYCR